MKISSRVAEQAKIYDLRKLGNFEKIPALDSNSLDSNTSDQLATKYKNFDNRTTKCKRSTLKFFTSKSFSPKFKNLFRVFCPELSKETLVYF